MHVKIIKNEEELNARKGTINKSNEMPLISVIVPTYNVEEYIKQCIDSLLTQTYRNLEIICVDDGSTDNTLPILDFLAKKDKRLHVIRQEHKGVSAARNRALEMAKGKYISFVDSDDFMQWNSYEILVEVAEKNDLDLIIFGANAIGDAPEWVYKKINTRYKYYPEGTAENVVFEEESARPFLWLHFLKRELLETEPKLRFDEEMEMGEDQLFQFEYVPRAKSVMVIDDKLYNYRIGRNCSLMQLYEKQKLKKFNSHIQLISNVLEKWKNTTFMEKYEDKLITWMINLTYYSIIFFPLQYQPELCKQVVEVINKYELKDYCIDWYERDHLNYIKETSKATFSEDEEKKRLIENIKREKYEIKEILNSKAFKLGRMFTKEANRLDLKPYRKYLK